MSGPMRLSEISEHTVRDQLRAAQHWAAEADVPDPLNGRDMFFAPGLTAQVLNRRIAEERYVGIPHCFRSTKLGGGLRPFVYMDPLSQLFCG
jgi:hypothetical protein